MVYVLQIVYCATLQSPAKKKIIPSYIVEFTKQLLKNAAITIKRFLTFQPTKTMPNFLRKIWPLRQNSLTHKYHGKSKEDTVPRQKHFK